MDVDAVELVEQVFQRGEDLGQVLFDGAHASRQRIELRRSGDSGNRAAQECAGCPQRTSLGCVP